MFGLVSVLILSSHRRRAEGRVARLAQAIRPVARSGAGPNDLYRWGLLPLVRGSQQGHDRLMSWTVADVMTKEVVIVGPETPFKDCLELIRIHGVSALPVLSESGNVLGIVSEADLLTKEEVRDARQSRIRIERSKASARTAANAMTSPAITIGPMASVPETARLMRKAHVKRLPVVDAHGKLVGITSRIDLLKTFMRSDESIRKDIADEVLRKTLFIDPKTVEVDVTDGLVRLGGQLETKSLANLVVRMVERVEGTVGVDSKLTYRFDDSKLRMELPPRALQLSAQERQRD
jgi:CBS domain-containing protein